MAAEMQVVADVAALESLGAHQSYRRMASAAAVTSQSPLLVFAESSGATGKMHTTS